MTWDGEDQPFLQPSTYLGKVRWLRRVVGVPGTLLAAATKPLEAATRLAGMDGMWHWRLTERQFDRVHGVDTVQQVQVVDLDMPAERRATSTEYSAIRAQEFGLVIEAMDIDPSDFTFIDLGSGKGRGVLLAGWFPFRAAIGVELARDLHEVAEANLARWTGPRLCGEMRVVHGDAVSFQPPPGNLVLFLHNPFDAEVLAQLLDHVATMVADGSREIVIAYGNGGRDHRRLLDATPWLGPWATLFDDYFVIHDSRNVTRPAHEGPAARRR